MSPRQVVEKFVEYFNAGDAKGLASLYHEQAEHDRIAIGIVKGRDVMYTMFERSFAKDRNTFTPINILADGNSVLLEWRDRVGMRGCNVFQVEDGLIRFQRSYWDKEMFQRLHPEMFTEAAQASN